MARLSHIIMLPSGGALSHSARVALFREVFMYILFDFTALFAVFGFIACAALVLFAKGK